jgi:hypothetical protein
VLTDISHRIVVADGIWVSDTVMLPLRSFAAMGGHGGAATVIDY